MLNSHQRVRGDSSRRMDAPSKGASVETCSVGTTEIPIEDSPGGSLQFRPEWQLACRIAASKRLRKSDLLPKFLLYVCEQQLLGAGHEITEQRIGTHIFNRSDNYNPGEDNIVRSYARLLRKRLEEYFDEEGSEEPMRIVIPRGGYVPVFSSGTVVEQPDSSLSSRIVEDGPVDTSGSIRDSTPKNVQNTTGMEVILGKPAWISALVGLIVGLLLASFAWLKVGRPEEGKTSGPTRVIWSQLFQHNRDTLIVPADSGLGILQNLTGHLVGLEEYANGTYLSDIKPLSMIGLGNLNDLRRQRYTSVVDLNITAMLTQLPEFSGSRSQIRYARSITTEDLKHSNAILLGSVHTNPWVTLFEKDLNFQLEYMPEVDQSFVQNKHPLGIERTRYLNGTAAAGNQTYGVIDYLTSLDGIGHVLIIQGLNMAATQAAADVLFNSREISPILKQAELPDGSLRSFELLIETSSIGATAPGSQIISTRFYPATR